MATILVTGATGALGSLMLLRLLAQGHTVVCLVRPKGSLSPQARVRQIVGRNRKVHVITGDVTQPRCGIADLDRERWCNGVDMIVHAAASISFDQIDAQDTRTTNITGVQNVLELAEVLNVWDIRHISTAYVAGDAEYFAEEQTFVGQCWRNPYEESKLVGETMMRAWVDADADRRRVDIYRLGILLPIPAVAYDGYYGFWKGLHAVMRYLDGAKLPHDIARHPDGGYDLPLIIRSSPTSTLNLVPGDWAGESIVGLINTAARNRTVHIVHPKPPPVRWVIEESLRILKAHGVRHDGTLPPQSSILLRALQRRLDGALKRYGPYITQEPRFGTGALATALGNAYRDPSPVDSAMLQSALAFALDHNFGMSSKVAKVAA